MALSGGGMRAIIFHLGVIKYLAEKKLLEKIEYISTVSGGSISVAFMYTNNNMRWSTSEEYLVRVLLSIRKILIKEDIEKEGIGVYIRIERSCDRKSRNNLSERECKWAGNYPTNLRKPSEEEFDRLLQHDHESAMRM